MGKGSFAVVLFCVLLQAVDYAIIFPSLWLYLQDIQPDIEEFFLGLVIGVFGLTAMITSPFVGWWLDKRPMKEVLTLLTCVSSFGMLLYAMAPNKWVVLCARAMCGIGGTIFSAANLYVIRITTADERSGMFAKVNLVMMIGFISGPLLNYPISLIPVRARFGAAQFSKLSAPGYLMFVLITLALVLILTVFEDAAKSEEEEDKQLELRGGCLSELKPIMTLGTLALVFSRFMGLFNQTLLESIVTPVMSQFYGFGLLYNSFFYGGATVLMVIFLILIAVLSDKFHYQDRTLLIFAWVFSGTGIALIMAFSSPRPLLWQFLVGAGFFTCSIPIYDSLVGSLMSKLIKRQSVQGRGQAILGTVSTFATVLGPVLSGALFNLGLRTMFAVLAGMWLLGAVLFALAYRRLYVNPSETPKVQPGEDKQGGLDNVASDNETTKLING